jgi:hypothetical protein
MLSNTRSNISEAAAPTDGARRNVWPETQDRHLLARMISAAPSRIIAVVGSDHDKIAAL